MIVRCVAVLALDLLVLCSTGTAQVPLRFSDWSEIEYRNKIVTLCESHIKNHRVRGTHKAWEPAKSLYKEAVFDASDREELYGESAWATVATAAIRNRGRIDFVRYLTPDARYFLKSETRKPPFKLESFSTEWKDPDRYATDFAYLLATRQVYSVRDKEKIVSHDAVTFEGQDALRLITIGDEGIQTTLYLAKKTYQFLYSETDKSPIYEDRGRPGPEKTVTRVIYRGVGEKQFPLRYERYRVQPDGAKRKLVENEITEYAPYTPLTDELDLEKRFGVTPVAHEPRPASAMPPGSKKSGSSLWYILGGVLAVVAAGLVFYARSRAKRREA